MTDQLYRQSEREASQVAPLPFRLIQSMDQQKEQQKEHAQRESSLEELQQDRKGKGLTGLSVHSLAVRFVRPILKLHSVQEDL